MIRFAQLAKSASKQIKTAQKLTNDAEIKRGEFLRK